MFDIRWIRENPEAFDAGMARRGLGPQSPELLALDAKRRDAQTRAQELQTERNALSKQIGQLKSKGEDASEIMAKVAESKDAQAAAEQEASAASDALNDALAVLPNLPLDDVPDGGGEDDNVEVRRVGEPPKFDFEPKDHTDIGEALGMMDFETAAKLAGSRFVLLSGALARLERALAAFMLDHNTSADWGYTETNPPALVNDKTMFGTGQLPKFGDDLFKTTAGYWLIPTAEVPLTNIVADVIVDEDYLPRRYTAMTWCFRSEAGAAGKDTRGMIRQHQFTKVEMVSVTKPEDSLNELERMTSCAEDILTQLGLPFRTMTLCTGDMGAGARKTYDIEVWLPAQERYREISSCSVCGDFQARRMNARFRVKGEKGTQFVHTLNGSGLAVGRTLIAILENYQQADGSVVIPDVLQPYMGGLKVIAADG
ncbi:MAG: serine--tRNA ligase [Rhodospirillales bacterium]|nr:serine--tRNA ligase [Rhodospirillales bacterium]MBO6786484.1 serine--tRNA ligase [Rhodospirillales bacterium]